MADIKITDNSGDISPDDVDIAAKQAADPQPLKITVNQQPSQGENIEVTDNLNDHKIETVELDEAGDPVSDIIEETDETLDPNLDKVVDEVIVEDSDELLDREDEEIKAQNTEPKTGFWQKIKNLVGAWWANKLLRNTSLAGVGILFLGLVLTPVSRYFMLNLFGVRVSASIVVNDEQTRQPLKNVKVSIAGKTETTNAEGVASFNELKLGSTEIAVEKRAFATVKRPHTLGLGSNPLGEVQLKATGAVFNFEVKDWLSLAPLQKVEASSGEFSAVSDKEGKIALVLDTEASEKGIIKLNLAGYRGESFEAANINSREQVVMVPAKKHAFISKRSGKYDLYSIDADGKNEKLLLAGTGLERDEIALAIDPRADRAALVVSRENKRSSGGFLMSGLYLVDLQNGSLTKVTESERIQIVDWFGESLVYVQITEGVSASNPRRHRLVTYNVRQDQKAEIASSNYFNDVVSAGGKVYYAPSNAFQENTGNAKLFESTPDGKTKKTILGKEAWNIIRVDYKKFAIATGQEWFNFNLGESSSSKAVGPPATDKSRVYIEGAGGEALWIDQRDGKGTLIVLNTKTGQEKTIANVKGLAYPAYWLSPGQIIFRVNDTGETADYVISTAGGEAKKITDVSSTTGVDSWYFYSD